MIQALHIEPQKINEPVETQSEGAQDTARAGIRPYRRASKTRERNSLDQEAVDQWRKVYNSMHGT
jgi:hypothetical protein